MGISAHDRIWVQHALVVKNNFSKPLQVYLMDDAIARWNDPEVSESRLAPLEEREALPIPLKFYLLILILRVTLAGNIDLNRVINDEINLAEWVNLLRVSALFLHSRAHSSQIYDCRHPSEVLE